MNFICIKCHQQVSGSDKDFKKFEKHEWTCDTCWTPIYDHKYEVNVKGAQTFLSPMGDALGDRIVNSVVREKYAKDNPDEIITFGEDIGDVFDIYKGRKKYDKVFWSNITHAPEPEGYDCISFSVTSEACALAKEGIYPTWREFSAPAVPGPERFAVIHERWIGKVEQKNMEPRIAFALENWFIKNKFYAFIVGNDEVITGQTSPYLIDMRKKLTLPEIAWLIKNSVFYFGKDSGLSQLAGACSSVPLVLYGYNSPPWVPKVDPSRLNLFNDGNQAVSYIGKYFERRK